MLALHVLTGLAAAASLDNTAIGGLYGSPVADNATAIWWNPASLAATPGTEFLVEGAPILAAVQFERDDPYNGGPDEYALTGVIPFVGLKTDATVPGLGLGLGLVVPYARGGVQTTDRGPGSFALREGGSQTVMMTLGAAYRPKDTPVSFGVSGSLAQNTWDAHLDTELTTSLDEQIGALGQDSGYTDAQIEDPNYTSTLTFPKLTDTRFTFSVGARVDLAPVDVSVAYLHGFYVDNEGGVELDFGCPPEDDTLGRFGAEAYGLCNAHLLGNAAVGYGLPGRIQGGLRFEPTEALDVEVMGAFVMWSAYEDFDIRVTDVENLNELQNENTAALVNQHRFWARDNDDTWYLGVDGKYELGETVLLGARVLYDRHAVPDAAMSPNNYDADTLFAGALVHYEPKPWLGFGLSYTHAFVDTREITDSAFLVTLDDAAAPEDRYFYPQMNGTYAARISRIGVSVMGRWGDEP